MVDNKENSAERELFSRRFGWVGWPWRRGPAGGRKWFFFFSSFLSFSHHSLLTQSRRCPLAERSRCTAKRKTSSASPTTGFWLASNKFRWKTFDGCRDPMAHRITKRKKLQRWPSTGLCWRFFFRVFIYCHARKKRPGRTRSRSGSSRMTCITVTLLLTGLDALHVYTVSVVTVHSSTFFLPRQLSFLP